MHRLMACMQLTTKQGVNTGACQYIYLSRVFKRHANDPTTILDTFFLQIQVAVYNSDSLHCAKQQL